jgi:hypothetical protein
MTHHTQGIPGPHPKSPTSLELSKNAVRQFGSARVARVHGDENLDTVMLPWFFGGSM